MHWLTLLRPVRDHEALENEWHIVIKAYKFAIFEILRDFNSYNSVKMDPFNSMHSQGATNYVILL